MYFFVYSWAGLALYALLSAGDWVMTYALLQANPNAMESNPFAAACLERHGWTGLAAYKLGGVVVFFGAVALVVRRRPAVAAGLVTAGCAALVAVLLYSHSLIIASHREAAERSNIEAQFGESTITPLVAIEPCWFAEPRATPPNRPKFVPAEIPDPHVERDDRELRPISHGE